MNNGIEPWIGTARTPCTTTISDRNATIQTTSPIDQILLTMISAGSDRHHQQMLDGAVLSLADERGAREHDRQHGDLSHQARDFAKPDSFEIGIEHGAQREIDGQRGRRTIAAEEIGDLAGNDALDITAAREGLPYARRIDIELNFIGAAAAIQHVPLEVRGISKAKCRFPGPCGDPSPPH